MNKDLDFFDVLALSDCAAQTLSKYRPATLERDGYGPAMRAYLRINPVRSLRLLWQNGDASARRSVAARVLIWLGHSDRTKRVLARIR